MYSQSKGIFHIMEQACVFPVDKPVLSVITL